jgi:hypothetical protein
LRQDCQRLVQREGRPQGHVDRASQQIGVEGVRVGEELDRELVHLRSAQNVTVVGLDGHVTAPLEGDHLERA